MSAGQDNLFMNCQYFTHINLRKTFDGSTKGSLERGSLRGPKGGVEEAERRLCMRETRVGAKEGETRGGNECGSKEEGVPSEET